MAQKYDWGDGHGKVHSRPKKTKPKPTNTTRPAYGTYDPGLDQQDRATQRGLGDLIADIGTANRRSTTDLTLGTQNVQRTTGRSLADLLTARTRAAENYGLDKTERGRQYGILAGQQSERMAAANVLGGAVEQARQKRAANQAREQGAADTDYNRFTTDSGLAEGRLGEDRDLALADLNLGFERGWQDRNETQLPRAQREAGIFSQDVNELRIDQAKQAGLLPPDFAKPKKKRSKANPRGLPGVRNLGRGAF